MDPVMLVTLLVESFDKTGLGLLGTAVGAGLVVLGAGHGLSRLGSSSVESMARQPEVVGDVRGAMLLLAAMLEGVALFAVVVCLLGAIFSRAGVVG